MHSTTSGVNNPPHDNPIKAQPQQNSGLANAQEHGGSSSSPSVLEGQQSEVSHAGGKAPPGAAMSFWDARALRFHTTEKVEVLPVNFDLNSFDHQAWNRIAPLYKEHKHADGTNMVLDLELLKEHINDSNYKELKEGLCQALNMQEDDLPQALATISAVRSGQSNAPDDGAMSTKLGTYLSSILQPENESAKFLRAYQEERASNAPQLSVNEFLTDTILSAKSWKKLADKWPELAADLQQSHPSLKTLQEKLSQRLVSLQPTFSHKAVELGYGKTMVQGGDGQVIETMVTQQNLPLAVDDSLIEGYNSRHLPDSPYSGYIGYSLSEFIAAQIQNAVDGKDLHSTFPVLGTAIDQTFGSLEQYRQEEAKRQFTFHIQDGKLIAKTREPDPKPEYNPGTIMTDPGLFKEGNFRGCRFQDIVVIGNTGSGLDQDVAIEQQVSSIAKTNFSDCEFDSRTTLLFGDMRGCNLCGLPASVINTLINPNKADNLEGAKFSVDVATLQKMCDNFGDPAKNDDLAAALNTIAKDELQAHKDHIYALHQIFSKLQEPQQEQGSWKGLLKTGLQTVQNVVALPTTLRNYVDSKLGQQDPFLAQVDRMKSPKEANSFIEQLRASIGSALDRKMKDGNVKTHASFVERFNDAEKAFHAKGEEFQERRAEARKACGMDLSSMQMDYTYRPGQPQDIIKVPFKIGRNELEEFKAAPDGVTCLEFFTNKFKKELEGAKGGRDVPVEPVLQLTDDLALGGSLHSFSITKPMTNMLIENCNLEGVEFLGGVENSTILRSNVNNFRIKQLLSHVSITDCVGNPNFSNTLGFNVNILGCRLGSALQLGQENTEVTNFTHIGWDGGDMAFTDLRGAKLADGSLKNMNLQDCDLSLADAERLKFISCQMERCHYDAIKGAELEMKNCYLKNVSATFGKFLGANINECTLENFNAEFSNLYKATLKDTEILGGSLENAMLKEAKLHGVNIQDANLKYLRAEGAQLEKTLLNNVDMQHANLKEAICKEVTILDSNLKAINLEKAKLEECMVRLTNLEHANCKGADLSGLKDGGGNCALHMDLREAKGAERWAALSEEQLKLVNSFGASSLGVCTKLDPITGMNARRALQLKGFELLTTMMASSAAGMSPLSNFAQFVGNDTSADAALRIGVDVMAGAAGKVLFNALMPTDPRYYIDNKLGDVLAYAGLIKHKLDQEKETNLFVRVVEAVSLPVRSVLKVAAVAAGKGAWRSLGQKESKGNVALSVLESLIDPFAAQLTYGSAIMAAIQTIKGTGRDPEDSYDPIPLLPRLMNKYGPGLAWATAITSVGLFFPLLAVSSFTTACVGVVATGAALKFGMDYAVKKMSHFTEQQLSAPAVIPALEKEIETLRTKEIDDYERTVAERKAATEAGIDAVEKATQIEKERAGIKEKLAELEEKSKDAAENFQKQLQEAINKLKDGGVSLKAESSHQEQEASKNHKNATDHKAHNASRHSEANEHNNDKHHTKKKEEQQHENSNSKSSKHHNRTRSHSVSHDSEHNKHDHDEAKKTQHKDSDSKSSEHHSKRHRSHSASRHSEGKADRNPEGHPRSHRSRTVKKILEQDSQKQEQSGRGVE